MDRFQLCLFLTGQMSKSKTAKMGKSKLAKRGTDQNNGAKFTQIISLQNTLFNILDYYCNNIYLVIIIKKLFTKSIKMSTQHNMFSTCQ